MKLSSIQQEIVNHKEGALLVKAGAGSGKTRVLTERIKKLLETEDGNFHVLALTFTNKAAKEMKERLEGVFDIENRAFIGTIHGFCQEIIEKHGYAIGLNNLPHIFEKNDDRISILIQVFEKVGNEDLRKFYVNKSPKDQEAFIYNTLTYISLQKKNLKGIEAFDIINGDIEANIQKMYNEYNDLLFEQNAMDFDDVILKAYEIFAKRPSIAKVYRKLYKYISIDEAQDLNLAQYEFIKILCNGEHKNILMVGDSNQSLYHFNGSDKKYMEVLFVKDFNASMKSLDINYRSSKSIIEIANKIKPSSMDGFDTKINGVFDPPREFNDEVAESIWVVEKIENLVKERYYREQDFEEEIELGDIAILARNRYLFKNIENELTKRHIKFNLKKSGEGLILDSNFIRIFDLGMRVLVNPFDKLHYLEIINLLEISSEGIDSENGFSKLEALSEFINEESKNQFQTLISSWDLIKKNENPQFRESLKILANFAEKMDEDDERSKILSDLQQLIDLWNIYTKNTNSELKSIQHFKTQIALGLISANSIEEGVTLSTIHLSKGLEYKVVFIIGMNEGVFPDYRSKRAGGKTLDEEKNIFYVAVTRAERMLYLSYPKNRYMPWDKERPKPQVPSQYLKLIEN